jgi:DNA mismatch repair ATPase MutS
MLVQDLNQYVAIAEEFANDALAKVKSGGLLHDRRVSRIITPGTLIDESFIDPFANNYVLAIHPNCGATFTADHKEACFGLAWLDLSTGHFYTQSTTLEMLSSAVSRISPREIVLDKTLEASKDHDLRSILVEDRHVITYCLAVENKPIASWGSMIEGGLSMAAAAEFTPEEVQAGGLLLEYVGNRLQGLSLKLQTPIQYHSEEVMNIDRNSLRGLEIKENFRDGSSAGTLLHALRRTVTKSGSRLLKNWLSMALRILS